jgi:hypothetical protein
MLSAPTNTELVSISLLAILLHIALTPSFLLILFPADNENWQNADTSLIN